MKLNTLNSSINSDELSLEIDKFISFYEDTVNSPNEIIGFHVDISKNGIISLLAAIKMGLKIAIVPTREPQSVIARFLSQLQIDKLFYTGSELFVDEKINHFSLDSISKKIYLRKNLHRFFYDSFTIMRTSGTTGEPKNALIKTEAHYHSARSVNDYFSFTKKDCWALSLPLFHVSGLSILFRLILAEGSLFLADNHQDLVFSLKQKRITHLSLVPAQLKRLLDERADLNNLKAVITGGDGLSSTLRERCLIKDIPLFETYGLTETASMIWVHDSRKNTGALLPHATIKLAKDGEINIGGSSLFEGYVEAPGKIEKPFIESYFPTGDIGQFSSNQLLLINRKNNRIISGGENIQAEEIERVLETHPAVLSCIVVAIFDQIYGERPRAYIKWAQDPLPDTEIRIFLRAHLAAYKIPKDFLPWSPLAPIGIKKPRHFFQALAQTKQA